MTNMNTPPINLDGSMMAATGTFSQSSQPEHYRKLRDILDAAYHQAASGKGKERHATDNAWQDQPIGQIGRMVGPGFNSGQAIKKLTEAMGMLKRGERDAAIREVLGAIVYSASVIMLIGEQD